MKRNTLRFLVAIFMSSMTVRAYAVPYYVNGTCGNDASSGTSSDCAAPNNNGPVRTIKKGISLTQQNGDEVVVADGTYFGPDNRNLIFTKFPSTLLPRQIIVRSENGASNCRINCDNLGRAFKFDHADVGAIDKNAVVQDFEIVNGISNEGGAFFLSLTSPTIKGCIISNCLATRGGAIYAQKDSNPIIEDCTISGNTATSRGGGLFLTNAGASFVDGKVIRCTIIGNSADKGGGIYVENTSVLHIQETRIENNTSTQEGGGVELVGRNNDTWIVNCHILGNSAGTSGGGLFIGGDQNNSDDTPNPHIINTLIEANTANDGGGITLNDFIRAEFVNNTIVDNIATASGGGLRWFNTRSLAEQGKPTLTNAIVWGNSPTQSQIVVLNGIGQDRRSFLDVQYSDIQGGWDLDGDGSPDGDGIIDVDPLFVDPDGPDGIPGTADDDFRLGDESPCIDAASDLLVPNDQTDLNDDMDTAERTPLDLDLFARFVDDPGIMDTGVDDPPTYPDVVDMGAYEFDDCSSNADCADDSDPCNGTETCTSGNCDLVFTDCNKNGIDDLCDIADGTSQDCNVNMIPDECEVGAPFLAELIDSKPAHEKSLWRSENNIVRLTFACDISAPGAGDVLFREMLEPPELFGSDLSSNFTFTVEDNGGGPRILKIDGESSSTLEHRKWYSIQNVGDWSGVADLEVQYVVQVGDANNDVRVLFDDLGVINARIPTFAAEDDAREDINGDGRILFDDLSMANGSIPSFPVDKPSGH